VAGNAKIGLGQPQIAQPPTERPRSEPIPAMTDAVAHQQPARGGAGGAGGTATGPGAAQRSAAPTSAAAASAAAPPDDQQQQQQEEEEDENFEDPVLISRGTLTDKLRAWVTGSDLLRLMPPWTSWPDYDQVGALICIWGGGGGGMI
jgi:hypothetical protein